jgi:hypothetical protein
MANTGGAPATGGTNSTGGFSSGGLASTGGLSATGGSNTGGSNTSGGFATGGAPLTGGAASGGSTSGTGGTATGGSASGGKSGGGSGAGGQPRGGASSGGASSGGSASGGTASGGVSSGGTASGGVSSGGKATGGATTGGTNSGGATSCGVQPVNPNSIPAVRNVLCYLYQIKGQSTLSGVQDCSWSPVSDVTYVNQKTGKYPAIVGGDFLYTDAVRSATASWNAGGLSMIRYHMGRPEDADSYESSMGTTDLAATLTPGTSRYNGLMAKFDHAAEQLKQLQNAGVVVLWAPFHETQPNGWFWWSKGTAAQFKQLWKLMYDNFTARGVNNVIWLMPYSGSPSASYYPGKSMVDISGSDTYGDSQPFAGNYRNSVTAVGSDTLPLALHETGYVPNPTDMFNNNQAPWVLFSVWCNDWLQATAKNSDAELRQAFVNTRTLNRGQLPRF